MLKSIITIALLFLAGLFASILFLGWIGLIRVWLRAVVAGVPMSIFNIIAMHLRWINLDTVVQSLIMAKHAGVNLSCADLERAYSQSVDLEKVTSAYIAAKKQNLEVTFDELVEAEWNDQLHEKLTGTKI